MAHPRSALDRAARRRSEARGVDLAEVRALALTLPGAEIEAAEGRIVRAVAGKGFAWIWLERVARADVLTFSPQVRSSLVAA